MIFKVFLLGTLSFYYKTKMAKNNHRNKFEMRFN